jgi:hypothetical protein
VEDKNRNPVTAEEVAAEDAVSLPNKEVMSLLDVNANVDLGLDLAAPVDLAAAANLNVAAPIEASAAANVLSPDAKAISEAYQHGTIDQSITGDASATAPQHASVTQDSSSAFGQDQTPTAGAGSPSGTTIGDPGALLNGGSLLDANVNLHAAANLAAPIDGAVAAQGNVAAPIDAAVSANVASPGATAEALAPQQVDIHQSIDGNATAHAEQDASVNQK